MYAFLSVFILNWDLGYLIKYIHLLSVFCRDLTDLCTVICVCVLMANLLQLFVEEKLQTSYKNFVQYS